MDSTFFSLDIFLLADNDARLLWDDIIMESPQLPFPDMPYLQRDTLVHSSDGYKVRIQVGFWTNESEDCFGWSVKGHKSDAIFVDEDLCKEDCMAWVLQHRVPSAIAKLQQRQSITMGGQDNG